jgi:transketolase
VRDISALAAMPDFTLVEPSCEAEVAPLLDWCLNGTEGSSYIRLVSVPWEIPFALPGGYRAQKGRGVVLADGGDAVLFAYGPVMLSEAWRAAQKLGGEGIRLKLVNLPWLNSVDAGWLKQTAEGCRAILTLDNHYTEGGQGEIVAAALAEAGIGVTVRRLGLTDIPASGTNDEVLRFHKLDAESIAVAVRGALQVFSS